ncbi:tRNA (N6-isopentenyl adenosine(37)-C2)-methylthiotransferase MiaB [Syntrophomonas wolfei]|uniref:tRNA-2-methylthio-N(6)-dimethylallyladenosine synthase n=1 Tax=Syntrophomonas wolfei subsp. wolfei (strain DSM 2245B / Goettingen) TaxID=335541 RepID=MIAB_SYNWW|nr:tRNA (N6-isopentenyl adenosine(37)-C2)-methylthiotransferase MiaB [Syntrophomonas wolfei]Q0AYB7.1 RecName: Full=tRNA-2-methylthio-N(6)-dimethylallyladenosine synthase; AltName: Full=(Dimethylallyl)adenosine tRNA methylthiotransferase MiaB; AltName: Full=tRNA-i(6)A37 methylthiotransferase [Syntrophomonas wolfei subsp. wolfei str. Goettingen G311]ABI68287.1 tRNA-i(6)A37 thiotransferase enzyme MiaB [Syntrophomonas wolfei subsp. wolfei str. Goettingen G311]
MGDKEKKPLKYRILTYGCQMNVRDSETIAGLLEGSGFNQAEDLSEADLIVFNTCSVRHSAENKVYGKLGEIASLKKKRPELLIAFGGCMAQLPEVRQKLKKRGVDVVFGTHNIHELPYLIARAKEKRSPVFEVWEKEGSIVEPLPSCRKPGLSAFVNIMFGCNNFCSYCIVPYTRGRERSRKADDIIRELEELAAAGYKEVTLLGQNVNSYGRGLGEKIEFADLLYRANSVAGIERIRFTTSHPKDVSDRLLQAIAECEKLCEHIHAPLQAGSNRILQRMNRNYSREHYLKLVERMRHYVPGVSITSDLIVGFPGETEEDFLETLDMVERVRFDAAFTFLYSQRSGTRAAELAEQIPLEEKKQRLERLNRRQYQIATEINQELQGSIQEVLVEGPSKTNPQKLTSRTRSNRIVIFSGGKDLIGRLINVKITEAKTFSLFGEIFNE